MMDVSESKKSLEATRHPLVSSEIKNGTTRRSQIREVSSRYRSPSPSPSPSPSHVSKRYPSPNISSRTSTSTAVPVPKRAISTERKRPSTPPSTPAQDTSTSRKTVTDKSSESSLWPSTMRSLNVSFQSDKSVSHNRPSSNVARKSDTPERKRSPLKGKNSADLSENSKVVDSSRRWPSRTGGKVSTNKSDITDKITKTPSLFPSRTVVPSSCTRRLSLDGTSSKPLQKSANDLLKLIPCDESRKEILNRNSVVDDDDDDALFDRTSLVNITDKKTKTPALIPSRTVAPSSCTRRLSLDGTSSKPLQKTTSDLLKLISRDETRKEILHGSSVVDDDDALFDRTSLVNFTDKKTKTPSLFPSRTVAPSSCTRRLSLDGTSSKPLQKTTSDLLKLISRDETRKEILHGSSVVDDDDDDDDALFDRTSLVNFTDKKTKTPSLFPSRTVVPSSCTRRLSLDGTSSKPLQKTASDFLKLISRDESQKEISHGSSVVDDDDDDDDALFDRTSMVKTDKITKTPSLFPSRTAAPSYTRRLSLDGTSSKPLQKSANDLLKLISREESRKEILHGSSVVNDDDDDALFSRTSLVSATTFRRQSLPNTATRSPSPSVSRRVSPSRARSVNLSSRGTSPARLRPSSPSRQPQNPVLSFVADIKKVKKVDHNVEDVHRLRLLYSRYLQWRYANARTIAALNSQKAKAEKIFYSVWRIVLDLCDVVREKRSDLQQLRLKLKLYSILDNQMTCLKEWASIERDHISSLTCTIQDLQATTIRIPVTAGATVDIKIVEAAMCSAVDVMMEMGSSLCSILPQVEGTNFLVSKLADVAANERAMLDECESLLRSTAAYQVEEDSLRTQLLQMNQALDKW